MTWVAIQATTPRDAYWKLTQAFFTARDESLRSRGPFYVLNNLVLEMSQPGVGDLTLADGHFTIHRWRKYLSDYTDGFFREFLGQCLRTKQHREEGYSCPVRGNHTTGICLMGVTFSDSMELTLFSRVTQYTPPAFSTFASAQLWPGISRRPSRRRSH